METIAHDGSGGGRSRRWGQAFEVVGGGGEAIGNREGSRGSSGNPEHQLRPALATSPAKRVSSIPFPSGYSPERVTTTRPRVFRLSTASWASAIADRGKRWMV